MMVPTQTWRRSPVSRLAVSRGRRRWWSRRGAPVRWRCTESGCSHLVTVWPPTRAIAQAPLTQKWYAPGSARWFYNNLLARSYICKQVSKLIAHWVCLPLSELKQRESCKPRRASQPLVTSRVVYPDSRETILSH